MNSRSQSSRGFVLITTMLLMVVLMTLLAVYSATSNLELSTTRFSRESTSGFYAAEAGLNVRAETIRSIFVGYNRPTGASPAATNACVGANQGSGDFICQTNTFSNRTVRNYVQEESGNPIMTTIPAGERYQYLTAQEYRYTAKSTAFGVENKPEAQLELRFRSRLVPLFQFAAFYNKDLEILNGPALTLNGPVHTNGNLYLNTDNSQTIRGQVTAAGRFFRGRKDSNLCASNPVAVYNPLTALSVVPSCSARTEVLSSSLTPWNGQIQIGVPVIEVPEPEVLDPFPGQVYWDKADLRLVLRVNSSGVPDTTNIFSGIEVRNQDNSVDSAATTLLSQCRGIVRRKANHASGLPLVPTTIPGSHATLAWSWLNSTSTQSATAVGTSLSFRNNRENKSIRMLDVDMVGLLNCLQSTNWFGSGKLLSDNTEGGLVIFLTVSDGATYCRNVAGSPCGVRLTNGNTLQSTVSGAPLVRGLTVVSDQAVYVQGNYNGTSRIPAALLADAYNILSANWYRATNQRFMDERSTQVVGNRPATTTTQNIAILAGTDRTGGGEGVAFQASCTTTYCGGYNGGLENYPRFHESWSGQTLTWRGSFVSLEKARYQVGSWCTDSATVCGIIGVTDSTRFQYNPPTRNWDYDTSFNNAANLPPITPRFVYLRQELFVRDFEQ